MTYCHECGSEVAENDIYCPYCGITLDAPSAAPGENASENINKNISNEVSKIKEEIPQPVETEKPANPAVEGNEEEIEKKPIELNVLEEKQPIFGSMSDQNPPYQKFPDAKSIFEPTASDEKKDDNNSDDSPATAIEAPTESSMLDYEEAAVKELNEVEELENDANDRSENANESDEPDFSATIPYMPKNLAKNTIADDEIETAQSDNGSEAVVPAISKPAEDLPEEVCPPPRFDSVKIIESKVESLSSGSDQSAAARLSKEEEPERRQKSDEKLKKESGSHTMPNIGKSDTDGSKTPKLKPLDEGTVLNGRYEVVRKIGGGGMGAVYLASDKNLGGVLRAVKEMVQSYIEGEQQEKAVNDFKRESLLLTSLEHPAIPTIYDYFFDDEEGRFYLVMKYISGGDLAARLRSSSEGRIDEKSVTEWAIQIADVLDYLHIRQPPIVYRDLKPANIMIDGNSGRVMLIDFGIARWVNKEEKGVTAVGTMGYAPPELFSGNVEPRSDIYSLGSTMFHLLTGADPQSNPLLIFDFQKHPHPRQINPQLSDQMEKILMRTVEYNAGKRYSSAAELRQELEDHLLNLKSDKVTYGIRESPAAVGLTDQMVFCGFCGQKIIASDMFCAFCGAKQPLAQKGVHSEEYASAPPTAQLLIVGTNELETPAFRIEKDENLVGRRDPMSNIFPEVDLSKYDPQTKISRRHARITRDGSKFLVEDLGSSNGTVVLPVYNDTVRLVPHTPFALTNGDKLRLGDTTLHFVIG